ncbi:ATP10 protein-domain-containing protein [Dichomitus squalens]|uniref:ATP10 protein-domain-containing protein n=1 Tax=Dichomitus squalens TaxID=114155 RepID=A0A4Q9MIY1_9APHY|nr:ATP10 protein-domain-containing protein [Dichomitus squalens]TBU43559.1 ATP10 protein-domain-containing protein [Dichomitus squalens]TBU58579.1 ATP10 protein-domain-containing protein [Dichomitus squalens]
MRSLPSLRSGIQAGLRPSQRSVLFRVRYVSSTPSRQSSEPPAPQAEAVPGSAKGKEKEAVSSVDASQAVAQDELPLLQRPLGVREKPKARVRTWSDAKEKFMDQDKRMEERTHLAREATRGYFADLNATRKHGGKTWIAPKVMIREDKALYFPDIHGATLAGEEKAHTTNILDGKVSVVTLLTTRISEIQTAHFVEPTQKAFGSNPDFQLVQINLQDNLVKSWLVSLFTSGIKKQVPEQLWPTYMISNQNMEYLREPLGIANKHVGYVYLVDSDKKIRWAACADPKSEEVAALTTCTNVLLDRLAKQREALAAPESLPVEKQP